MGGGVTCSLGTTSCYCLLSRGWSWATCSIVVSEQLEASRSGIIRLPRAFSCLFGLMFKQNHPVGQILPVPSSTDHLAISHSCFWKPSEGRHQDSPLISCLHQHIPLLPGHPSATRMHIAYEIISFNEDPKKVSKSQMTGWLTLYPNSKKIHFHLCNALVSGYWHITLTNLRSNYQICSLLLALI